MSFADIQYLIDVTPFSGADQAVILGAMRKIYEDSPIAREMMDKRFGLSGGTLGIKMPGINTIDFKKGRVGSTLGTVIVDLSSGQNPWSDPGYYVT